MLEKGRGGKSVFKCNSGEQGDGLEIRNYLDEWKSKCNVPKHIPITAQVPKEERSQISIPTLYVKGAGKRKETKHKACRTNGIRETTNNIIKGAIRNDRLCTGVPRR